MARSTSGESLLTRAVRIFDAFGPEAPALTVTEIARRARLPRATAGRLVEELVRHGLLRRDGRRRIRIGVRFWELAQRASPTLTLREAAMPFMADLHAVVGHSTQLGVLDGAEVLFVERLTAPDAVVNITRIAGRLPLHASSTGLFGMGLHQCVGQHVARLEAEALLTALAERVARIEPAGEPRRHLNNTLRAWESMPLRLVVG
ncbi:helix-turn-helix domain-containing protein [Streptomyces violens]|uniref:helix-turn-helix domain-containing protein n=1 Tax=Streptomyces violens TaxID=66377 RepID=UPI000998DDAC|nr:helix-turn-helix domain-containing protein [Streptomyces violens]